VEGPSGQLPPSAHDMVREQLISALS
jgi:hypothetical protein